MPGWFNSWKAHNSGPKLNLNTYLRWWVILIIWVIVYLHQGSNFSALSWPEQVVYRWDDDDAGFVQDQHAKLEFKMPVQWNKSASRHVAPLGHIILISIQRVYTLYAACLEDKQEIPIL